MDYEYTNKITEPNLLQIKADVSTSAMLDKTLVHTRWDEEGQLLKVVFSNTLSTNDKTTLDGIITANS